MLAVSVLSFTSRRFCPAVSILLYPSRRFRPAVSVLPFLSFRFYPAIPEGKPYSGAELILTPPATPEPVLIDEGMVSNMLNEYKSHFLKELSKGVAHQ